MGRGRQKLNVTRLLFLAIFLVLQKLLISEIIIFYLNHAKEK